MDLVRNRVGEKQKPFRRPRGSFGVAHPDGDLFDLEIAQILRARGVHQKQKRASQGDPWLARDHQEFSVSEVELQAELQ